MTATRKDIREWLDEGLEKGATHVVIVHDHWDHENFPLYIMPGQDARETFRKQYERTGPNEAKYSADECYNLSRDIEKQLAERRAYHWE